MRLGVSLLLLALPGDRPCAHATRGDWRAIDLRAVERAHRDVERAFTLQIDRVAAEDPLSAPYDSGLPACRGRSSRSARVEALPAPLVGRSLRFGPDAREGLIHVVTSARALRDAVGGVLATPELAARFGVSCAPSTARVRSAVEVEIDEGD